MDWEGLVDFCDLDLDLCRGLPIRCQVVGIMWDYRWD